MASRDTDEDSVSGSEFGEPAPRTPRARKAKQKTTRARRTRSRAASDSDARSEEEDLVPRPQLPPDRARVPQDAFNSEMRACIICSLVKDISEFELEGCDNCESVLKLAGQRGTSFSYTSNSFEGLIALVDPKDSWVAKWQHLKEKKKGVYAISVKGDLPRSLRQELSDMGVRHYSRDKSRFEKPKTLKSDNYRGALPPVKLRLSRKQTPQHSSGVVNDSLSSDDDGVSIVASTVAMPRSKDKPDFNTNEWRSVVGSDDEEAAPSRRSNREKRTNEYGDDYEVGVGSGSDEELGDA